MTLITDKVHAGMDLFDLLLRDTDETNGCYSNQPWSIKVHDTPSSEAIIDDEFLDTLLDGSNSSSSSSSSSTASPLWSPCTTEIGISVDSPADHSESPHPQTCPAFPAFDTQTLPLPPPLVYQQAPKEKTPYVAIDLEWAYRDVQEQFGIAYYLTTNQISPLISTQTSTVKDLLLSNLGQKALQIPQQSLQELVLNEDEKKLLVKEGVKLPSKLPLSKFEERVLKKIRRKIRNKHSAQESRKKKREYVDSLEGRMSECSSNNLLLQRKIQQLEETNNALLEQLTRLQALLPDASNKTTHRGTCILVWLVCFSLLIPLNIQPEPYSQLSHGEYSRTKAPSRTVQSFDEGQDTLSLPLLPVSSGYEDHCCKTEKL